MNVHIAAAFPSLNVDQTTASALVGLVLPLLISVVLQAQWNSKVKSLVALAVYGVAGVVTAALAGELTGATAWQSALEVFITAVVAHKAVYEPTGVTKQIEVATTPGARGELDEPDDVVGADPAP